MQLNGGGHSQGTKASSTMGGPRNLFYQDTRIKEGQNPSLNMQQLAVSRFEPLMQDDQMHYSSEATEKMDPEP